MATRQRPTRVMHFAVSAPGSISDAAMKRIIEEAIANAGAGAVTAAPKPVAPKPAKVQLRTRKVRAAATYPCRRQPDPLWAAAIIWPTGVAKQGCGRTYASEGMRDAHEAGFADRARTKQWNPVMFPHGCLDRIVPAELRDTR